MLSLIVCNKELTPLGSIGVLSIIWETVKQNTQSYAQTGTHTQKLQCMLRTAQHEMFPGVCRYRFT